MSDVLSLKMRFLIIGVAIFTIIPIFEIPADVRQGKIVISDPTRSHTLRGDWNCFSSGASPKDFQPSGEKLSRAKVPGQINTVLIGNGIIGDRCGGGVSFWVWTDILIKGEMRNQHLLIMTPYIESAFEAYFNGRRIGGEGEIGADGRVVRIHSRMKLIPIPNELIAENNRLVLRMADNERAVTFMNREFYIGAVEIIQRQFNSYSIHFAALAGMFLIIGVYYLIFFLGSRRERVNIYFALISIISAGYTLAISTISYTLIDSSLAQYLFIQIFVAASAYCVINFFHAFYQLPKTIVARAGEALSLGAGLLGLLGTFYLPFRLYYDTYIINIILIGYIPLILIYAWITIQQIRRRWAGAVYIGSGLLIYFLALVQTILVYFQILNMNTLEIESGLILVIGMAAALSHQYSHTMNELNNYRIESESELELAESIQRRTLPLDEDRRVGILYRPYNRVGGDFFDIIRFRDPALRGLLICDVEGHGVPAAMITSMIKSIVGGMREQLKDPALLLTHLNDTLHSVGADVMITALYAFVDSRTRKMTFASAGHPLPIVLSPDGITHTPIRGRPPLALFDGDTLAEFGKSYENFNCDLPATGKLFLFTDGIFEIVTHNNFEREFTPRLEEMIVRHKAKSPRGLISELEKEIDHIARQRTMRDDITLVCYQLDLPE